MKIVCLSTYPVSQPRHGGQQRLANIVQAYRDRGHDVRLAGVLGAAVYAPEAGFLPFPGEGRLSAYLDSPFLMEDWCIGRWAAGDDGGYAALAEQVGPAPDLLHVEQPWLFGFARRYALAQARRPRVVYGSQNQEHRLKAEIVTRFLGDTRARAAAERVLTCEHEALAAADAVAAVSADDARWCASLATAPVVLAPNGVADRALDRRCLPEVNAWTGGRPFALYCASGHPPNITGFYDLFGVGLGCLAPGHRLVVAGGAGPSILAAPAAAGTPGLARQLVATGEVSEATLSALLHAAHAVVLPVTQGAGTNLKTAEALWSGHAVVATSKAMRGFEAYLDAPGVACHDDPPAFRAALRDAMQRDPLKLTPGERERRRAVLWTSCLQPLVRAVEALVA